MYARFAIKNTIIILLIAGKMNTSYFYINQLCYYFSCAIGHESATERSLNNNNNNTEKILLLLAPYACSHSLHAYYNLNIIVIHLFAVVVVELDRRSDTTRTPLLH